MDTQTLNRDKGDLNVNTQQYLSTNKHNSIQSSSISEKTQQLSIISNNETQLDLKDILAFQGQVDNSLFNEQLKFSYIKAERMEFHNIEQIKNQRLLIENSQNCSIYIGVMIDSQQQIVIKEMVYYQVEYLMQNLDEFKIQNKLNNLFPQQSLLLYTPVQLQKFRQYYGLRAVMEKAETNLYIYSKKNKINANQAYLLFRLILKQLINMHSIQIAHRDVKPQNIFYVINKGWVLSDFGESQEYYQLESNYNIRGTLYFLKPSIQSQVNKGKQIQQNLLANDLYALVVTIIIIQKIHEIDLIDIHQEIRILAVPYLVQTLNIQTYKQLIEFEQKLPDINEEFKYNIHDNYYKQFSPKEEQFNQKLNHISWIQLCSYYIEQQIFLDITTQLLQLINENLDKIEKSMDKQLGFWLSKLQVGGKLIPLNPIQIAKRIKTMNTKQIESLIFLLFNYGYSEKTIFFCQQILTSQYNQFIHIKLIDSLERLMMYSEAYKQFKIFQQGLIFESLNSEHQLKFLQKIQFYGSNNFEIKLEQNLEDLLIFKNIHPVNNQEFEQDLKQYDQFDNQEKLINFLEKQIKYYCSDYNIFGLEFFFDLSYIIFDYSLNIQNEIFSRIYDLRLGVLEMTRRTSILFDLAQISILQSNMKNFRQLIKTLKIQIFKAESLQQNITFKIQMLVLKYYKLNGRKCTHTIINKLYLQIKKIKQVSYKIYKIIIQQYFFYLIKLFQGNFYLSPKEIKLVILITDHIYNCSYQQQNFNNFQSQHLRSQYILIKQLNYKRYFKLIRDYQDCLSEKIKSHFKNHQKYNQVSFYRIFIQKSEFQRQNLFLFEQFLQKE